MSLLADFLGTEDFSLMDSPMFQELVENIKNNRIYSANREFDYSLNLSSKPQKYRDEIRFTSRLDEQNGFYNLNSINNVNTMSKHAIKNRKTVFSYFLTNSENSIITKENCEVAA
ncbi:hypothetical protein [Streptococcus sp. 3.1]|jgi:hypothetical protein|uniref:hypothetical protein n=1 Tax=Streptococcus sp. 3.1 TaxID=2762572 RepID=UPI0019119329|nr:hypothetical protein [Streptococcus sp. 3.1]MBK5160754.1 hypothetical protein [Streptococcus sp. 3.1]MBS5709250.1 hypothetical protein [Veillonella sp.]